MALDPLHVSPSEFLQKAMTVLSASKPLVVPTLTVDDAQKVIAQHANFQKECAEKEAATLRKAKELAAKREKEQTATAASASASSVLTTATTSSTPPKAKSVVKDEKPDEVVADIRAQIGKLQRLESVYARNVRDFLTVKQARETAASIMVAVDRTTKRLSETREAVKAATKGGSDGLGVLDCLDELYTLTDEDLVELHVAPQRSKRMRTSNGTSSSATTATPVRLIDSDDESRHSVNSNIDALLGGINAEDVNALSRVNGVNGAE